METAESVELKQSPDVRASPTTPTSQDGVLATSNGLPDVPDGGLNAWLTVLGGLVSTVSP